MATSLMRRNPLGAIDPFQTRMWDWITTPYGSTPLSKLFGEADSYVPPVDIYETNEEVIVAASLPGLDISTVDIRVLEDKLTLAGKQNSVICFENDDKVVQHLRGIPRYGQFEFSFALPCSVEADRSHAKYDNGLLCMRFPKSQRLRAVRIPINGAGAPSLVQVEAGSVTEG